MATLLEIKTLAASYLDLAPSDFTVNGMDLFLAAANQVRKTAELEHDFEFNRKSVTVTVNGTTGGNLELARDADNNLVDVKTVIEVGLLDQNRNLIPVGWTTVAESLEGQRQDNPGFRDRLWRTDDPGDWRPVGRNRFTFSGKSIRRWPMEEETAATNYAVWLEAYCFTADWLDNALASEKITISGTLVPDVTGDYFPAGTDINGDPIYIKSGAPTCAIYTDPNISPSIRLGQFGEPADIWASASFNGTFNPAGSATGTATSTYHTGATTDVWTTHGQQFLLWATIVQLNKRYKFFVPRQEGNLPPPTELADAGLAQLVDWDGTKFEGFRRHNR